MLQKLSAAAFADLCPICCVNCLRLQAKLRRTLGEKEGDSSEARDSVRQCLGNFKSYRLWAQTVVMNMDQVIPLLTPDCAGNAQVTAWKEHCGMGPSQCRQGPSGWIELVSPSPPNHRLKEVARTQPKKGRPLKILCTQAKLTQPPSTK